MTDGRPVIIIGAGISGLSAAKYLKEQGIPVLVIEANNRVGGRTYTTEKDTYGWVDRGGSWVGPTQNHLLHLLKELKLDTYPTFDDLDYIHYSQGRRCRYQSLPSFWWSSPLASFDLRYVFNKMEKMCREIPPDCPWDAPKAKEWDTISVGEFYRKNFWTKDAMEFMTMFVNVGVTSEPDQLSLLWFLWYVRTCDGFMRFISSDNGGQEFKIVGGTNAITKRMAEIVGWERVKLGEPVVHVEQYQDGVTVHTKAGNKYDGSYVIQCAPLPMHLRMTYEPPLPSFKRQLCQRVAMGVAIKVIMWFRRPFWMDEGLNGMVACGDGEGIISFSISDFSDKCKHPGITSFVTSDRAVRMLKLSPEDRRQQITDDLLEQLGCKNSEPPLHYEEYNWLQEPYIGGCYTATYPPHVMSVVGHTIRTPHQRMHFAGTETAVEWSGYMNGAVEAGQRAAKEILHRMGRISESEIWAKIPECDMTLPRPFELPFLYRHPPSVPQVMFFSGAVFTGLAAAIGYFVSKHYLK